MNQTTETIPSPPMETKARSWRLGRILAWLALGLAVILLIAYLAVGVYSAHVLTLPERKLFQEQNPGAYGMAYEDVRLQARDGEAEIAAWYIDSAGNDRAVILVHGRDASRTAAFKDRFPELAASLNDAGFSVLMIDLRGHGESSDARFSFGLKERYDVLGGVDWLIDRGYEPGKIGVLGVSLGAAASIGATAEETAIGALVTDSGFADIYPILKAMWEPESGLPTIFLYSTMFMSQLLYGYDITDSKPVKEIGSIAPRPMMLIHCRTDEDVHFAHMEKLKAAAPSAETWLIPVCDHAEGYVAVKEEYDQKVSHFFDQGLK